MSLSAALHAVLATLRRRPSDLVPVYVLGAAAPAIARLFALAGLGLALLYLEVTGRLGPVVAALASRNLDAPDPNAEPAAFQSWVDGLAPVLEPLFTPVTLGAVALGFLLTVLALVVFAAAVSAGQIAACHARLRGQRGLTAGIAGVRRHWLTFLGAYLLEVGIWAAVSLAAVVVVTVGYAVAPVVGILLGTFAFLVWFAVVALVRAVFAFVPAAVVVDEAGVVGSIRGAGGFLRRNPFDALGYYLIALGTLVALSTVVGVLTLLQAEAAATPIAILAVGPVLDLAKTGLYADHRDAFDPPSAPAASIRRQLSTGTRRGLHELAAFVRREPGVHVLAILIAVAGVAMGWLAAEPFVGAVETSIVERLADHVPPAAALNFFGNNLTVALATAYSGVALAVPAAVSLWFNGVLLGAVGHLEVDPTALLAFVAPHGIFELPALVISGALGLHLGVAGWRTWRGRASRVDLADALERAFWVLVGIGVLVALAALIEGFVSPYYWRPFL